MGKSSDLSLSVTGGSLSLAQPNAVGSVLMSNWAVNTQSPRNTDSILHHPGELDTSARAHIEGVTF